MQLNIAVCLAQHALIQQAVPRCTVGKVLQTWLGALLCLKLLQTRDRMWKLGGHELTIAFQSANFFGTKQEFCAADTVQSLLFKGLCCEPTIAELVLSTKLPGTSFNLNDLRSFYFGVIFLLFLRFCEVSVAQTVHYCAIQVCLCMCIYMVCFLLLHVLT